MGKAGEYIKNLSGEMAYKSFRPVSIQRWGRYLFLELTYRKKCVFSMSHPISTAYDGTFDRFTRTETGERLYANLRNYGIEDKRAIHWVVDGYELYSVFLT